MNEIKTISIDIETFSDRDLSKCGVYKYCESPLFEILLFAYSINGGEVKVIDMACGEKIPDEILKALVDEKVIKWAFNASFERICLSRFLLLNYPELSQSTYLKPDSWRCSLVWSAYMGLPLSLKGAGAVLGLDKQKMEEGKDLIRFFCVPRKPTKNNPDTRNLAKDNAEKWSLFKEYNIRDVEVEMQIQEKLRKFPVPDRVWEEYRIDQTINDRGILIDLEMAANAIEIDEKSKGELEEKIRAITALENPNSVAQMKDWLKENDVEVDSLGKKQVKAMIKDADGEIKEVLEMRQQLAKSSVKKYQAMVTAACDDGRARGMFQFYGASRTGRFSGRLIQLQNLPQNHLPDLDEARGLVRNGDYSILNFLYDDVPDTLSQLIRTAFIPSPGYKFYVADYSAIEARVLSFIANEKWRLDVFASGGDIYCASASHMFGVPVEKHGRNAELRQKGKIAELALGYGGSVGALKAMGAIEMGLTETELQPLVDSWRGANPNIVRLWWDIDRAVKTAIKERTKTATHGLIFEVTSGMLFIHLPSGRHLSYPKPQMGLNKLGGESVTYEGTDGTKKWARLESYGPKFCENIIQAISRDILCNAMSNLDGFRIVGHVHDELIIECKDDIKLEDVCAAMGDVPAWFKGANLTAAGYICDYYQKD